MKMICSTASGPLVKQKNVRCLCEKPLHEVSSSAGYNHNPHLDPKRQLIRLLHLISQSIHEHVCLMLMPEHVLRDGGKYIGLLLSKTGSRMSFPV